MAWGYFVNLTVDWRKIAQRTARKVERAASGYVPAQGTQAALRCDGIAVVGSRAWMNAFAETKYPYPMYEIETGEVAIVAIPEKLFRVGPRDRWMDIDEPQEYVN